MGTIRNTLSLFIQLSKKPAPPSNPRADHEHFHSRPSPGPGRYCCASVRPAGVAMTEYESENCWAAIVNSQNKAKDMR
jgi:hypothetical protein